MDASHKFDLALDPIDGTTNVAKGLPGSICCLAAASPEASTEASLKDIPTFYMMKLAYGEKVRWYMQRTGIDTVSISYPIEEIIPIVAKAFGSGFKTWRWWCWTGRVTSDWSKRSDGQCHGPNDSDGDITAAIAPSIPGSGVRPLCRHRRCA